MGNYFTFDRINNDEILSFYSRKPMDFGGPALEGEGRKALIGEIEQDLGQVHAAGSRAQSGHCGRAESGD